MKKILILVVDDDESIVEFLETCLAKEQYQVETAYNGVDGFSKAKELKPDLIILDLLMPDMHGFDVCQAVRQDETLKNTKILISSGKGFAVDKKATMRLGANEFLVKPYAVEKLLEAVSRLVS